MRIAVVAQQSSPGGGTRFLRPLVNALAEQYRDISITVFVNSDAAEKFGAALGFESPQLDVAAMDPRLYALPIPADSSLFGTLRRRVAEFRGRDYAAQVRRAGEEFAAGLSGYDLVYLSWPYFLQPLDIAVPTVGTYHDFNFKHDFGSMDERFVAKLEEDLPRWIDACAVSVTSAAFIDEELMRFFGNHVHQHRVVRLSTLRSGKPDAAAVAEVVNRCGLPRSYIVCPSNTSPHKNLAALFPAVAAARAVGAPPLVLIGNGTREIIDAAVPADDDANLNFLRTALAASGLVPGKDVYALGFVSDQDADAVISAATLLVAPSLYEAGSGPSLDAWSLGTTVAMSAIPPFEEHVEFLGVQAGLFDPRDPVDISACITRLLAEPDRMAAMARESEVAMSRYTWGDVAAGYREAFEAAIESHKQAR